MHERISSTVTASERYEQLTQLPAEWNVYQRLVAGIPQGIAVRDVCIGGHWILVEAESGCGVSMRVSGGQGAFSLDLETDGIELRDLAACCASWNFSEASVGVAALNAWYSTPDNATAAGMKIEQRGVNDAFELYRSICAGKRVCVVGHFPLIERLADECELSILERNPSGSDWPDPACEYLIPHQDCTFITGTTLTNKTMPRLLELASASSGSCVVVGPSVVPAPLFFDLGVDCLAGSVVVDPERARSAIVHGVSTNVFKHGVQKMRVERPGWPA